MDIQIVKNHLISEEGFVGHVYPDHLGYATIGFGRLVDQRKGGGITREEAEYLLDNDIGRRLSELRQSLPWFNDAPDAVQMALLLMAFQMGVENLLEFKTTLSLIRQGKYAHAADNALKSLWAKQTPARAKRVTDMIRNAT